MCSRVLRIRKLRIELESPSSIKATMEYIRGGYILKCSFGIFVSGMTLLFIFACAGYACAQTDAQPAKPAASQPNQPSPSTAPAQQQQQTSPSTTSAQPKTQPGQTSQESKGQDNGQSASKDRLFFALPNFLTLAYAGAIV